MGSKPIRVLIGDDHTVVRKGMRALLAAETDIEVVGEAADGREVVDRAEGLHPDVVLLDLVMPELDGIEAIRQIASRPAAPRVLVLTSFATDDKVFPAIKAGAHGYLLKDCDPEDVVRAIRQVHKGESSLHPAIARKVLQEIQRSPAKPRAPESLSEREMAVLRLLAQGLSNREIAEKLVLTDSTVRGHISSIFDKLQLASRVQAVLYALREGLASLDVEEQSDPDGK